MPRWGRRYHAHHVHGERISSLGLQPDKRLDADSVEDLLKSGYRNSLVFRLLVTAHNLFTHTQPASQFSLGDSLRDPHLRDKGRDLIQAFDVRKRQLAGLEVAVFAEFLLQLPDHA